MGKNEEHVDNFVPLVKENPISTTKRKKTLTKKMMKKMLLNIKKDIKDIGKHACYYFKTLCFFILNSSCFKIIF